MRSIQERYMSDADFKKLVDLLENFIHTVRYTPSELREAVMLAAIRYEQSKTSRRFTLDSDEFHSFIRIGTDLQDNAFTEANHFLDYLNSLDDHEHSIGDAISLMILEHILWKNYKEQRTGVEQ